MNLEHDKYLYKIAPGKQMKKRSFSSRYYKIMPRWLTAYGPRGGGYNYAYYFIHPWRLIEDWLYQIKWFCQRGYRGYADCDGWSIDGYLVGWLPKALRRLRDSKIGHPYGMTTRGWRTRLEKMADGFDAAREISEYTYKYKSTDERLAWRRFNHGMKLFHKYFFSLWD